jgi:hypothetical protein
MVHATLFDVIAVSALLNAEVATAPVRLRRGLWSSAEACALKNGFHISPRNDDLLVGRPRVAPLPSLFALNRWRAREL